MNENYQIPTLKRSSGVKILRSLKGLTLFCALMLFAPVLDATAQITYTLGTGNISGTSVGVSPYATGNINSRSQYLYLAEELLNAGASSGNIISFDMKITEIALPATLKPENVMVKMGTTQDVAFTNQLIPNLPVYFTATMLPINQLGWYTITLNAPFEWDGQKNIILEICRSNSYNGTSFGVECTLFNQTDFRTVGLISNTPAVAGCNLTGPSTLIQSAQRTRPNIRFTMTNPCTGNPSTGGAAVVSSNASCDGTPFTLSVANGPIESGLAYEWQWAPNANGPWATIDGATNTTYTTSQSVSTWYRRGTLCIEAGEGLYSTAIQVAGTGCFCTAGSINTNEIGITNVSIGTINNSSSAEDVFSNYTTISTVVNRNSSYNLSVMVNTEGGSNYTSAWIDWNKNGTFEASEFISLGTVTGGNNVNSGLVASVTVPSDAVLGTTVMRVRTKQSPENTFADPCGLVANGEAEDYTLNVDSELSANDYVGTTPMVIATSNGDDLRVLINMSSISAVSVYDISGRLVAKKNVNNQQEVTVPLRMKGQVAILKITTAEGLILNKKVILN